MLDKSPKNFKMGIECQNQDADEKLYQIMKKCWEENPNDRPTFEKLRKTMKDMERNHKTYVNLNKYDNSLYANINDLTAE